MSAYDDQFHVLVDSRWLRFQRDLRLIRWLAGFFWVYLTVGRAVRREYRRKKRLGEPFYID